MDYQLITHTPITKRVPEYRKQDDRVTAYGLDNLYPQRMKEVMLLSPITKSAVNLIADFIRGDGFSNGDIVVNSQGDTANELLRYVSLDYALYNGYAMHLNATGLGRVSGAQYIPFEYVRLGLANQKGNIDRVAVSNNWESYNYDLLPNPTEKNIVRYELFNPKTAMREALTTKKGQVWYFTGKRGHYPISSIDAIIETCHSDAELQNYELGNLTNGFISMSIFKYPGGTDAKEEAAALAEKLNSFKGARNTNSIMVAAIDEDFTDGNLVEQIPANNNDSLYVNTTLNVKNRILQNFALPAGLMGMLPEGAVFTATQLADEYTYMNLRTKDQRNMLQKHFQKLGFDVGEITPKQFESSTMLENGNTTTSTPLAN